MATCLNRGSITLYTALHETHDHNWTVCEICVGCIADMLEDDEFSTVSQVYIYN